MDNDYLACQVTLTLLSGEIWILILSVISSDGTGFSQKKKCFEATKFVGYHIHLASYSVLGSNAFNIEENAGRHCYCKQLHLLVLHSPYLFFFHSEYSTILLKHERNIMWFTGKKKRCFKTVQSYFNRLFYVLYNKRCSKFLQFQAENKNKYYCEKKPHGREFCILTSSINSPEILIKFGLQAIKLGLSSYGIWKKNGAWILATFN